MTPARKTTQRELLRAAYRRGEVLSPCDALRLYGIANNSFARCNKELRDGGMEIAKVKCVSKNGVVYYQYYLKGITQCVLNLEAA